MIFDEFPNLHEYTFLFQDELDIFGDFNIHLDNPSVNNRSLLDILDNFSLHQHVTFPTHIYGHWLDLFITRSNCKNVKAVSGVCDHITVLIDVWLLYLYTIFDQRRLDIFDQVEHGRSPQQVTHLPPVWDILLPLA